MGISRKKLLVAVLLQTALSGSNLYADVYRQNIDEGWKFRQARLDNWYDATVPGVVHTDLIDNGIIDDPFFRLNERAVQWVDKEDWIYETSINGEDKVLDSSNQYLVFKGLDTYADVYLNDSLLLKADNMFREWKVDIKGVLKKGDNKLKVYFHSPIKIDMPKWEKLPYQLESGNDQSENGGLLDRKVGIFARKAGYHYGWDWGPRLVTSGIWRPVYLEAWNDLRIENVQLIQNRVNSGSAKLSSVVEIISDDNVSGAVVTVKADGKLVSKETVNLVKGLNKVSLDYTIKNPKLWWTNGLGDPYLYDFTTTVTMNDGTQDSVNDRIGIRSLRVVTEKDEAGTTLYFELNGKPVFMKGANYIPSDNFLPRVTDEKYERTILDAKNVNMNMLRIWGGGIYENDIFYDLCDEHGILVWQDFMFACSLYPGDDEFIESVRQEAIYNVRRLRNHPCIALWCGNNENQDAWFGWGWKRRYEAMGNGYAEKLWNDLYNLYFKVLPEIVEEYGGGTGYRGSSPMSFPGMKSDGVNGDSHYWGVWHANDPISQYNTERSRFFSEYGFQSFPEYESVKIYAPEKRDHDIYSEVMMSHQRGGSFANGRIEEYMLKNFKKPKDFEHFLYVGMILQGDAIKTAMEAHRRDMPYCMGSLFWQHNDCWPVASWSSRDYYGRWKAQHYFAKNAYDMILVSPVVMNDKLTVHLVSDYFKTVSGNFSLKVMDMRGNVVYEKSMPLKTPVNGSELIFESEMSNVLRDKSKNDVIIYTEFETDGKTYTNIAYAAEQKDLNYEKANIIWSAKKADGGFDVTLKSDVFARGVFMSLSGIDNFFEDNYFDLLPGKEVKVHVSSDLSLVVFNEQLKVISLVDSYM
ncbi:glycoside hydrolase family 2 protein [uncultured Bacteroides sp.]|uniref:beta-mannosidase n=1 Tax=uncultured Bacteroides sp. TaxID=162156 RepID=UPI00262CA4DD|nr:glycoside hydrolase family 2 protein [uncultured Bacteroides sp.]